MTDNEEEMRALARKSRRDDVIVFVVSAALIALMLFLAVPWFWNQINRPYCDDPGANPHHCKVDRSGG